MAVTVELFVSPVCDQCAQASKMLEQLVEEIGSDRVRFRKVDVLDEIDYAVAIGVLSTPAVAINSKLVFASYPGTKALRTVLENQLNARGRITHE